MPALIIRYMKNRYLHFMFSGSFAAEESLTLKINWLDPDFLVEDGMVVSDGSPHGTLTIPPFPSKTQVFVIVKIEITKLTIFDGFYLSIVSFTMVIWYFWNDIVCFWVLYTSLNTTSMQNQFSSIFKMFDKKEITHDQKFIS